MYNCPFIRHILVKQGQLKFDHQIKSSDLIFLFKSWLQALQDQYDDNEELCIKIIPWNNKLDAPFQ